MTLAEEFGWTVEQARLQRGMSMNELARVTEIAVSHIGCIEQGTKNISLRHAVTLAAELGISLDALVEDLG